MEEYPPLEAMTKQNNEDVTENVNPYVIVKFSYRRFKSSVNPITKPNLVYCDLSHDCLFSSFYWFVVSTACTNSIEDISTKFHVQHSLAHCQMKFSLLNAVKTGGTGMQ